MTRICNYRIAILILMMLLGSAPNEISAQSDFVDSDKIFRFIYVAHDDGCVDDPQILLNTLLNIKNNIDHGQDDPSIFYLSNGVSYDDSKKRRVQIEGDLERMDTVRIEAGAPIVIKMYVPGDNRDEFQNGFLQEIHRTTHHDVIPEIDLDNILQILQDADFLDENNNLRYGRVSFDFFVHQRFWEMDWHKKLIAALYFVLGAERFDETKFKFNIHHMIVDVNKRPTYWKTQKANFGDWNISDINNAYPKVELMQ